jgi:hypothetical protein
MPRWSRETLAALKKTRAEILEYQRELAKMNSDLTPYFEKHYLGALEKELLDSINKPEKRVRLLATTVYPQYRNLLIKLNLGERQDIYARYHGYLQEDSEAMASLRERIETTCPIKLLPVNPKPVRTAS